MANVCGEGVASADLIGGQWEARPVAGTSECWEVVSPGVGMVADVTGIPDEDADGWITPEELETTAKAVAALPALVGCAEAVALGILARAEGDYHRESQMWERAERLATEALAKAERRVG